MGLATQGQDVALGLYPGEALFELPSQHLADLIGVAPAGLLPHHPEQRLRGGYSEICAEEQRLEIFDH